MFLSTKAWLSLFFCLLCLVLHQKHCMSLADRCETLHLTASQCLFSSGAQHPSPLCSQSWPHPGSHELALTGVPSHFHHHCLRLVCFFTSVKKMLSPFTPPFLFLERSLLVLQHFHQKVIYAYVKFHP